MRKTTMLCGLLCVAATTCLAAERVPVEGVWRLVSFEREFQAGGEHEFPMGRNPSGYILFLPEGRMAVVITAEGRKAGTADAERALLYDTLVAYTGTYRIDGDRWITKVEVSANPAWVGSEQARTFRLAGDRLQEITAWLTRPDNRVARAVITYERVQADAVKTLLLRPGGWLVDAGLADYRVQSEMVFESRGDKVVAKIRNLTLDRTCERDVALLPQGAKFDGCIDWDIVIAFDPADPKYPFKGKSEGKGHEYKFQPK